MKSFVPFGIGTLICAHSPAADPKPREAARSPNIILFLVDDMGLMDSSVPMFTDGHDEPQRVPVALPPTCAGRDRATTA